MSVFPESCACVVQGLSLGGCRYCKALAWGMSAGVVRVAEVVGPRAVVPARKPLVDKDDVGGFRSEGKRNSARAQRKARLTRIRTEREKFQSAIANSRERSFAGNERTLVVLEMLNRVHEFAPMQDTLLRRLSTYLRKHPEVALVVAGPEVTHVKLQDFVKALQDFGKARDADTDEADDYRNKVARPSYLTAGTRREK